jgi:hypothetical protein
MYFLKYVIRSVLINMTVCTRTDWNQILIKLSTWLCVEIRMQGEVTVWRLIVVSVCAWGKNFIFNTLFNIFLVY